MFCKPWPAVSSIVCPGLNNRQNWQIICLCKHLPLSFKQTNKQTKRFHVLHVYLKPGQTNWLKKYLQNLFYLLNEISHIVTFTFTWNVKCKMAKKIDLSFKSLKKNKSYKTLFLSRKNQLFFFFKQKNNIRKRSSFFRISTKARDEKWTLYAFRDPKWGFFVKVELPKVANDCRVSFFLLLLFSLSFFFFWKQTVELPRQ